MKAVFHLIHPQQNLLNSIDFLDRVYGQNVKSTANKVTFDDLLGKLKLIIKLIFTAYITICFLFLLSPAIIYIVTGVFYPMLPLFIPGTGPDSFSGIALSSIYHCCAIINSVITYYFFDAIFAFQILHVALLSNIIRNKVQEVNRLVSVPNSSSLEIKIKFRNLLLIHNEMITYAHWTYFFVFYSFVLYFFKNFPSSTIFLDTLMIWERCTSIQLLS